MLRLLILILILLKVFALVILLEKEALRLDEVIVTGTSRSISIRHLPMSISVVNNLDIKNISDKDLQKARNHAIKQAQEATFHQENKIANLLNTAEKYNKIAIYL